MSIPSIRARKAQKDSLFIALGGNQHSLLFFADKLGVSHMQTLYHRNVDSRHFDSLAVGLLSIS